MSATAEATSNEIPPRKRTVPTHGITPPAFAKRYGFTADKVLYWIRSGQIRAYNVALDIGGRARWIIPLDAIDEFLTARSNTANTAHAPAPRRRKATVDDFDRFQY